MLITPLPKNLGIKSVRTSCKVLLEDNYRKTEVL